MFNPFVLCRAAFIAACSLLSVITGAGREIQDFNFNWKFHLGDVAAATNVNFSDVAWRPVRLPHDWSIELDYTPTNTAASTAFLPAGIGWYRKTFAIPASAKGDVFQIEFDGVNNHSEVWLNGRALGQRPYGYSAFSYDLTPHLNFAGSNVLAVRVDHSRYADSRWYAGSGIYRDVRLVRTAQQFIPQWGVWIETPVITKDAAEVRIFTQIEDRVKAPTPLKLRVTLLSPDGKVAGEQSQVVETRNSKSETRKKLETRNPNPDHATVQEFKARTEDWGNPPHEPGSSGRESAPSKFPEKSEPTHVGGYSSGVQSANLGWAKSHPGPLPGGEGQGEGERGERTVETVLRVARPVLWDVAAPALYQAKVELLADNQTVDDYSMSFGIRSAVFDANRGFLLNGRQVKLKGVCLHHDAGCVGVAFIPDVWRRRLAALQDIGVNAIRSSHNPAAPGLLKLCDEMGFVVINEAFDEWRRNKDKWATDRKNSDAPKAAAGGYGDVFEQWAERDIKDMVRSSRHHPSVILWSIGNEIEWTYPYYWRMSKSSQAIRNEVYYAETQGRDELKETAIQLRDWIKQVDRTRPVTAGGVLPESGNFTGYYDVPDVMGYNYDAGFYAKDHAAYPARRIYGSENWGWPFEWDACRTNDFVAGIFVWTGIAYMGEAGPWPRKGLQISLLDFAGFRTPRGHCFRTLWRDDPYVYLGTKRAAAAQWKLVGGQWKDVRPENWLNKWTFEEIEDTWNYPAGEEVFVEVFANTPEVELFVNGKSRGVKRVSDFDQGLVKYLVVAEPGEILVAGLNKGARVAEYRLHSTGKPVAIRLKADRATLTANRYDVLHVEATLVDQGGHPVPDQDREITFQFTGDAELIGVDNGWENSIQPHKTDRLQTQAGKALAVIRAGSAAGKLTISARAPGLACEPVTVELSAPAQREASAAWRALLDPGLTQWDKFIGVPHGSLGLPGVAADSNGKDGQPLGLNNDPLKVFTTIQEAGETVLAINARVFGGLTTRESFGNYHLRMQFKWGEKKWAPRADVIRDNGLLYHCTGPHGAFWNVWKRCLEFQVQENDMGDYYGLSGTVAYMPAKQPQKEWFYDPTGPLLRFATGTNGPGMHAAHRDGNFEKPNGEWNTLEVYTLGRTAVHVVNGHVVLVLLNTAYLDGRGQEVPLSRGQLQLQSEGADAFYRRIEIQPITEFPDFIQREVPELTPAKSETK